MAVITAIPLEEAIAKPEHEPSERTLATKEAESDARAIADNLLNAAKPTAVKISYENHPNYLSHLRAALRRMGHKNILIRAKRSEPVAFARLATTDDEGTLNTRRATGTRLGQLARERAKARKQQAAPTMITQETLRPSRATGRRSTRRAAV